MQTLNNKTDFITTDVECIHGLIGCAVCQGIDEGTGPLEDRALGYITPWTDAEKAVALDMNLTSRVVGRRLGRTTNQASAQRINVLGITGYAGYVPRPR